MRHYDPLIKAVEWMNEVSQVTLKLQLPTQNQTQTRRHFPAKKKLQNPPNEGETKSLKGISGVLGTAFKRQDEPGLFRYLGTYR